MSATIATPRLRLEPIDDASAAAVLAGRPTVACGDGWPHADTPDALRMLGHGSEAWFVVHDGLVIGDIGTHGPPDERGDLEIGYGLALPYRGRGFASESVRALTPELLARPNVRRVVARDVDADNVSSRRTLEAAGFHATSESEDRVSYAIERHSPSR